MADRYSARVVGNRFVAARYNLIDDFLAQRPDNEKERAVLDDDISVVPFWVMAVIRLSAPSSYSRDLMNSFSTNPADGARTRGEMLIITDDCAQMQVQGGKGSHTSSFSASLLPSEVQYDSAVLPGDWVLAWMVNSEEKGLALVERIRRLEICNRFDDGFKFVGRVQDTRRQRRVERGGGIKTVGYTLSAIGFAEMDAQVFFDPQLAENTKGMGTWLARLGKSVIELLDTPQGDSASSAAIDINRAIPFFFDMLLGDGIAKRAANPGGDAELQIATGLTQGSGEAPFAYLVPTEVGQLLGKNSRSKQGGILAYADLVELMTGIHRYVNAAGAQNSGSDAWRAFIPDGIEPPPAGETKVPQHKKTDKKMLGQFIPTVPDFSNKPVWSVLSQWLNPTINEMYTALRVNEAGFVVPQVIVRQMPFSSDKMVKRQHDKNNLVLTPYHEVPRWVMHPLLVYEDGLGRSNATRFNFIHIFGHSAISQKNNHLTYQLIRNPPIRDDLDIQRSGLRPYMTTVNCSLEDTKFGPRKWAEVASDWLMGQHLTLNGTVVSYGIQAPITHGDNLEWDGIVYHIEGYAHSCGRTVDGHRHFTTSLTLTHGMRIETDPAYRSRRPLDDSYLYPYLMQDERHALDPGLTLDGGGKAIEDRETDRTSILALDTGAIVGGGGDQSA